MANFVSVGTLPLFIYGAFLTASFIQVQNREKNTIQNSWTFFFFFFLHQLVQLSKIRKYIYNNMGDC